MRDRSSGWSDYPSALRIKADEVRACNCIGPQRGEPVCPCRMSALKIVDGRYVEVIDHGPATARSKA